MAGTSGTMITALEIAVLALAPWPFYRLLGIPVFRRSFFCYAMRVVAILVVYAIAVTVIALYAPALLHLAAAMAAAGLLIERLRARPAFGRSRKLPPGSLSPVPRGPWTDDEYFTRAARRYGPIFKVSQYFRPMICVIGARRGMALLKAHEDSLTAPPVRFSRFIPRGFLRYMAPADHDRYKRLFQTVLSRAVLKEAGDGIRMTVRRELAAMATETANAGDSRGGGIDPRPYLSELLLAVFLQLFLGVGRESANYARLSDLYRRIDIRKASCASSRRERQAAHGIAAIVVEQLASFREMRKDGRELPACFLAEFLRQDPAAGSDETVLLNLVYMVQTGRADMAGLLAWTLKLLCDNRGWLPRIREDLDSGDGDEAGAPGSRVIREALRLEQSEFLFRQAVEDIEFGGYRIPRGWAVRICIREGHRDPDIFNEPQRFDPARFRAKSYTREEYSPLGMLRHSCLGAQIVDAVGTVFVDELARRYDCAATRDGPREYGRAHWEPASSFRISLTETAASRAASG